MLYSAQSELSLPNGAGFAIYPPGASFGPRSLHDFEFVWIAEGDSVYENGENTYDAPAGSIVLCKAGSYDKFLWDRVKTTRHGFFHFDIFSVPESWPPLNLWPIVVKTSSGDIIPSLFRYLLEWCASGDPAQTLSTMALILGAFVTGQTSVSRGTSMSFSTSVELALKCILDAAAAPSQVPLTLGVIAEHAQITSEHLCRLFDAEVRCSPMKFYRNARLDHALDLIVRSNYSLAEIASICGFSDAFHFSRRFTAAFDLSPSAVRKSVANGDSSPKKLLGQIQDTYQF